MRAGLRASVRAWNTATGLLTLPLLVVSALTGAAIFAVLSGAGSPVGPMTVLAVHAYSGLVGLPLVVVKSVAGAAAWRAGGRGRRPRRPLLSISSLVLVLSILVLYGTGVVLHLDLTPGGNAPYKAVHLWSAVVAMPFVTIHLGRHLRIAGLAAGRVLGSAEEDSWRAARRRILVVGGLGLIGWGAVRVARRVGDAAVSTGPNDFPVTIAASGSDEPDPASWRLEVDGDVAHPQTFTLAQLRGIGLERHRYSLDCILGWSVVREWGGVPLAEILTRCVPSGELLSGVFGSTTGYQAVLLAEQLADRRAMITLEVDGVPLASEHGFPARVMAPDVIGEKCVKWVERLTVVCA